MMTKKDFKELADMCAEMTNNIQTALFVKRICAFCLRNNSRFDEERFKEYIRRLRTGESLKGLG